jgi:hypothetical protein
MVEPGSNVNFESFSHILKQSLEIKSTDEGIEIDRSDEQFSNADSPRMEIREPAWNRKSERAQQYEKHDLEMALIDEGMQMD